MLESISHYQNGILLWAFSKTFSEHQLYVWLPYRFKTLVCFVEIANRRCTKKYVCLKHRKILGKNLSFHSSGDSSSVVPFLYGPMLTHRSDFVVRLWSAIDPTLSWYQLSFTPNYEVMVSRWIFWLLLELITMNWN